MNTIIIIEDYNGHDDFSANHIMRRTNIDIVGARETDTLRSINQNNFVNKQNRMFAKVPIKQNRFFGSATRKQSDEIHKPNNKVWTPPKFSIIKYQAMPNALIKYTTPVSHCGMDIKDLLDDLRNKAINYEKFPKEPCMSEEIIAFSALI